MGWFNDDDNATQQYNEYQNIQDGEHEEHKAKLTHEFLGGAAAYEATKAYEDHVAKNGQPDDHARAKEILAGFVGAFVDREAETKGLDWVDREEAKRHGRQQAEQAYDQNQY